MPVRIQHFLKKEEARQFNVQGNKISLKLNEKVFPPSQHGTKFFAKHIKIKRGENVIDIGTGSGILAILAAKMGGVVVATDTDENAIMLGKENAKKNKVPVNFIKGPYFAKQKKFDVIIANLPQEILPGPYKKAIGKKLTKTIHGGPLGNKYILKFLKLLKNHVHKTSRAYVVVYSVTDFKKTLDTITKNFTAKLLAIEEVGTKEFVPDNIGFYKKLIKKGLIALFHKKNEWKALLYIFELKK